jgi:hypothetical protein
MTTIADLILDPTMPLSTPVVGVDSDPTIGSGALTRDADAMDAPEDFSSDAFTFDPWV